VSYLAEARWVSATLYHGTKQYRTPERQNVLDNTPSDLPPLYYRLKFQANSVKTLISEPEGGRKGLIPRLAPLIKVLG